MTDNPQSEQNLTDEFRHLGENLVEILRAAWESPERKRIQDELESGLTELGTTLRREADHFASSPGGQQLKADIRDLNDRVRSGEVQSKAHDELLKAMQTVNEELNKVIQQWSENRKNDSVPTEPDIKSAE